MLAAGLLFLATAIHANAAVGDPELPGEVLVKLLSTGALGPLLVKYQLGLVNQFGARPIYRLKVVGPADLHDTVESANLAMPV